MLGFPLHTPAQDFKPEKFDKALLEDSIKEQAILREEMEQIRLEMQRIMEEIKLARLDDMNTKFIKLKSSLQKS